MKTFGILLSLGLLAVFPAGATMVPVLSSPVADGANFAFNYQVDVSGDERLDPAATNGVTCPGPGSTLQQCNPPGTFFTIYDIPGFVSASTTAAGWTVITQFVGLTPSTINGSSFDSASLVNVTFSYNGPVLHGNGVTVPIPGFQIISSDSATNSNGTFTSQATLDTGPSTGDTDQVAGSVTIPADGAQTPEPVSLLLLGSGMLVLSAAARRKLRP